MRTRLHKGFGHGLSRGEISDINCHACKSEADAGERPLIAGERFPEGWLVQRVSDGRPGIVRNAWEQQEGTPDAHWRVFVEATDAPSEFLSTGMLGEVASKYAGIPVYAPDIERAAGRRYRGELPNFTELGGYPLTYFTAGGNTLCAHCATKTIDDGNDPGGDSVTALDAYYEGPSLNCDECGKPIESAYGDPEEGNND